MRINPGSLCSFTNIFKHTRKVSVIGPSKDETGRIIKDHLDCILNDPPGRDEVLSIPQESLQVIKLVR